MCAGTTEGQVWLKQCVESSCVKEAGRRPGHGRVYRIAKELDFIPIVMGNQIGKRYMTSTLNQNLSSLVFERHC